MLIQEEVEVFFFQVVVEVKKEKNKIKNGYINLEINQEVFDQMSSI